MSVLLESLKQKNICNKFEIVNIIISKDTDAKIKIINKKHLDPSINLNSFRKKIINSKTQSIHNISIFKEDKLKIPKQLKNQPKDKDDKATRDDKDAKDDKAMRDDKDDKVTRDAKDDKDAKDEKNSKDDKATRDDKDDKATRDDDEGDEPLLIIDERLIKINGQPLIDILPTKQESIKIKPSTYYLHNREKFVNFVNSVFKPYKEQFQKDKKNISCSNFGTKNEFALLTHQELVRDYINIYSPYRGLLLYHGLGAGKTCSSIAIAEGLKTTNQIMILTPASLKSNYIKELKKCGDPLYKLNQFWEFINTDGNKHLEVALSKILSIHIDTIRKNNGAWLVNNTKPSNYEKLSLDNKNSLNKQLDFMISVKYMTINYNGLRANSLAKHESDAVINHGRQNIFDNKVVIIDEAHNFVSRIVNKIESKKPSLSKKLYEYLLDAHNCRVILLTGTPIINYPNEIGILYNILRGYIKTYELTLDTSKTDKRIDNEKIKNIFKNYGLIDYIEYIPRNKKLRITRNPYGFISKINRKTKDYNGIVYNERGNINDKTFKENIIKILSTNSISVKEGTTKITNNKALPDSYKKFNEKFIDPETYRLKNHLLFKKRILGLTSYFRSAQESLLPKFDEEKNIKIVNVPMSIFQLGVYETARTVERKEELRNSMKKKTKLDELLNDSSSTYRIFSRAFCNFVFPDTILRPLPSQQKSIDDVYKGKNKVIVDEDVMDGATIKQKLENIDGRHTMDDTEELTNINNQLIDQTYGERIIGALKELDDNADKYLSTNALKTYSPKFREILKKLNNKKKIGIHLIYSQFRTLEGIGILSLILNHNGWARFKISKPTTGVWKINMNREDLDKPCYALYTGTEDAEEKEIIRNILNSQWDVVPESIKLQLTENGFKNNHIGNVIKCLMITSSGAEGIDLKNVRYFHIV